MYKGEGGQGLGDTSTPEVVVVVEVGGKKG